MAISMNAIAYATVVVAGVIVLDSAAVRAVGVVDLVRVSVEILRHFWLVPSPPAAPGIPCCPRHTPALAAAAYSAAVTRPFPWPRSRSPRSTWARPGGRRKPIRAHRRGLARTLQ